MSVYTPPPAHVPVDFSFREVNTIADFVYLEPQGGRPKHKPLSKDQSGGEYLESLALPTPDESPSPNAGPESPGHKSPGAGARDSVRLCNNSLLTLKGLDKLLVHLLGDPAKLTWLDLSCNQLSSIEDVVTTFPNLQVLYLHGNQIASLHDVLKLSKLPKLQKLTLHGNPISEKANYKVWVLSHLPELKSLDFSGVTKLERDKVQQWFRAYLKRQQDK